MSNNLLVVFYESFVRFVDGNLALIKQIEWKDQLPNADPILNRHGIAHNFKTSEHISFIGVYKEDPDDFINVPRNAVYDKHHS